MNTSIIYIVIISKKYLNFQLLKKLHIRKSAKHIVNVYKQICFAGCPQTLADATPLIQKIYIFSKIAITLEP